MDPNENRPGPEELYVFDPHLSTTIEADYRLSSWAGDELLECHPLYSGCGCQFRARLGDLEYLSGNKLIARCPRCGKMNRLFDRETLRLDAACYRKVKRAAKKNRRKRRPGFCQRVEEHTMDLLMEHGFGQAIIFLLLVCLILSLIASIIIQFIVLGYTTFW